MPNITNIPAPRVEFIDPRTGLMSREWYRFFLNLFQLTGNGSNDITLTDLQVAPQYQDQYSEFLSSNDGNSLLPQQLLAQDTVSLNTSPQYEDQSGNFSLLYSQSQLSNLTASYDALLQNAWQSNILPPAQFGTIAPYNLDYLLFSPVISGSGTPGTVNYINQVGLVSKFGRNVIFSLDVEWDTGTGVGDLTIEGLPFQSSSLVLFTVFPVIADNIAVTLGSYLQSAYLEDGSNVLYLAESTVTTASFSPVAYSAAGRVIISGQYFTD